MFILVTAEVATGWESLLRKESIICNLHNGLYPIWFNSKETGPKSKRSNCKISSTVITSNSHFHVMKKSDTSYLCLTDRASAFITGEQMSVSV